MGRSGYTDDCDNGWELIKWRGQVASAMRGKRGQAFLKELLAALDAMPVKALIREELQAAPVPAPAFIPPQHVPPAVCAIGSVGVHRGVGLGTLDPEDFDGIAATFGITHQLVREIEFENDEVGGWNETPERRWERMRAWVERQIRK